MKSNRLLLLSGGVLAFVTACGASAATHPASSPPSAHSSPAAPATQGGTSAKPSPSTSPGSGGIPQNGGGDHDTDNSGGPSDGDGNI
jgi:hypothetical protein